jgi:hypothetical protein
MAEARDVDVVVGQPLPGITADIARLELVTLISNAIKYSDPRKSKRVVEIDTAPSECPEKSIFSGFYRGYASRDHHVPHRAAIYAAAVTGMTNRRASYLARLGVRAR